MNRRYLILSLVMAGILAIVGIYAAIRAGNARPSQVLVTPSIAPSATTASTASSSLSNPLPCGEVATVFADGQPVSQETLQRVRTVHDIACRRDYEALAEQMTSPFDGERTPKEVLAGWRRDDPEGAYLAVMASTLETKGHPGQGDLTFCQRRGAVVVFARGTYDHPGGQLSAFYVMREESSADIACSTG